MNGEEMQKISSTNICASRKCRAMKVENVKNPVFSAQSDQLKTKSPEKIEVLYSRANGHKVLALGSSSSTSFSGSDPVEHDEEAEVNLSKRGSSRGLSESSGYTGSLDRIPDPVLDRIPCDPDVPMMAYFHRNSRASSSSTTSDLFSWECSTCKMFRDTAASKETMEFWSEVETPSQNSTKSCHSKFWIRFYEKLKEKFPKEDGLNSKQTKFLLKTLLEVCDDVEGIVELSRFLKIVRFFGPVKNDGDSGRCCLVKHLHEIMQKSVQKDATTKERLSWFAGEMSRTEADSLLRNQRNCTFLVRMSQSGSDNGDFVVSVVDGEECIHFEIEGNPMESAKSPDLNCHLRFLGRTYRTLPEVIGDLRTTPLHDEDSGEDIWCRRICPNLPFNNVMTPYKRTK
ncbi:uncharacterized protein LOC128184481 [Crassostrea angulata]|uniref:uncharacterized protein LOC128184481 n=1 Tax=Magallana angulata TaxID=2784310 RepID=UPI0022B1E149|nr:uncharacterized protein LOC128184481 [Crassostrea angulata]